MNTRALRILVVSLGLCAAAGNLVAQVTETNLHSFAGLPADGDTPLAGLVQGSDGNFYGTTQYGGAATNGTVFRISSSGSYSLLYSFGSPPNDGFNPAGPLVQGADGNFYGTTVNGGTNYYGTVFRITPGGNETIFYPFHGSPSDGYGPYAGLVRGSDGNFYGTTGGGGMHGGVIGFGTVFRITPGGSETVLYSFGGSPNDGAYAWPGLVQGTDGNFYGTTTDGGSNNAGIVFRISPDGNCTNLYSFGGPPNDGANPYGSLAQGSDGNFYGTTINGGTNYAGTVFRISPGGSYTLLHNFAGHPTDGAGPAGLVQGSDGNFYGMSNGGGSGGCSGGCGTVFRITPSGSETVLYSLGSQTEDGTGPYLSAGLVQGSDGNFYGTTMSGGTNNAGTVFKLIVPHNPPANQISAIQVAGTNVLVSIPSVAAEMYQLQNRTSLTAGAWTNVEGQVTSIGGPLTVTNLGGFSQSQQFYRFAITP
jgi:uncharacterized repeat protein (TIGR03803 family)